MNLLTQRLLLNVTMTTAVVCVLGIVTYTLGQESRTTSTNNGKASIGEQLFFDPILSSNLKVSCASCHLPANGYTSGGLAKGLNGEVLPRRAPSIMDLAAVETLDNPNFFWDGRAKSLEQQLEMVLTNPREMGNKTVTEAYNRVKQSGRYPTLSSVRDMVQEIVTFERSLKSKPNRHDRFLSGINDAKSLTEEETRGWDVFRGDGQCYKCHTGENFTDNDFHNTGVGIGTRTDGSQYTYDRGRFDITQRKEDTCKFKTPGLRGCSKTAPYMHNGSIKTLEDLIEFYDRGGVKNKNLDKDMQPLKLTPQQKSDLLAFLRSL